MFTHHKQQTRRTVLVGGFCDVPVSATKVLLPWPTCVALTNYEASSLFVCTALSIAHKGNLDKDSNTVKMGAVFRETGLAD